MKQIVMGIGSLASPQWLPGADSQADGPRMHLDLGPEHPSRTGLLLIQAQCRDDAGTPRIESARVQPGFSHRSAEKLFEVRDYRQVLVLADRHDWQAPFIGELGAALVCEQLMGLVPPPRATWLRTLLSEQARIASHLAHLSFVGFRLQDEALVRRVRQLREQGRELMLAVSGNRVHPMLNRLGGLSTDLDSSQVEAFVPWAAEAGECARELARAVVDSALGRGIAILDRATINGYSLSGPVAAASGVRTDCRIQTPYLAHAQLQDELLAHEILREQGDAASRLLALADQVITSHVLIEACARHLQSVTGPVDTKLSKNIKVPDSEGYLAIEAPWGMAGWFLVSRSERTPWRLKMRTPGFANVQALQMALQGCPLDEADVAIASLGWTSGDLDK
ncbi:NADH-quinone oxidoreductase subunit D [Luteococcus sp.]|uniref:NADH-quinone oxidoreductase subunit D-related protein n=1 Tax=Luteococcus sp. TaxID=1969402 RepID=UPI003735DDCE